MNQIAKTNAIYRNKVMNARLGKMTNELRYAWNLADKHEISKWGLATGNDFAKALKRRVKNVGKLLTFLAKTSLDE